MLELAATLFVAGQLLPLVIIAGIFILAGLAYALSLILGMFSK